MGGNGVYKKAIERLRGRIPKILDWEYLNQP